MTDAGGTDRDENGQTRTGGLEYADTDRHLSGCLSVKTDNQPEKKKT